jgi:hypothetical protein
VLPSECYVALAQPRATRSRRKLYERLDRVGKKLTADGVLLAPDRLALAQRRKLDELKTALASVRLVGLDVRPEAFGARDELLYDAIRAGYGAREATIERARRDATRRLAATARAKPLGRTRETIVRSLALALGRVAAAKGVTADGLASVLLLLRDAAVEAGARMVAAGLVDDPEDALYLYVAEIGQALTGEPGAYAARVRLRREDDARWAAFTAPRRIERRRRL